MAILAVDPGTAHCGWVVVLHEYTVAAAGNFPPDKFKEAWRQSVDTRWRSPGNQPIFAAGVPIDRLLIEHVGHYGRGMAAGASVFDTCVIIGELKERALDAQLEAALVQRGDVKLTLCGSRTAKDSNVRQAVIDHYRRLHRLPDDKSVTAKRLCPRRKLRAHAEDPKGCPICRGTGYAIRGPLCEVSDHAWQALGLAVAWLIQHDDY